MQHLVSVGGGFSSTIELPLLVIDKYGKDNVELVIAALEGESPDLWRLVDECEKRTGLPVKRVCYAPDEPTGYLVDAPDDKWWGIWKAFRKAGRMGSSLVDPCSDMLKRKTMRKYVITTYTPANVMLHVGITASEIDRMIDITSHWQKAGYQIKADLADVELVGTSAERSQKLLGWTPLLYLLDFPHNNCGGFCVKAGHEQMAKLLFYYPWLFAYHEWQEYQFQMDFNTKATIMRDRVSRTIYQYQAAKEATGLPMFPEMFAIREKVKTTVTDTIPLSLREFRLRMELRWKNLLPGMDPFAGLESTPGCQWCEAA